MNKIKLIQKELNIVPTSFKDWLKAKLDNQNMAEKSWTSQWKLQLEK